MARRLENTRRTSQLQLSRHMAPWQPLEARMAQSSSAPSPALGFLPERTSMTLATRFLPLPSPQMPPTWQSVTCEDVSWFSRFQMAVWLLTAGQHTPHESHPLPGTQRDHTL